MPKPPEESVLFHGEIYSRREMEKHNFPVGCKFHYKNASYNDLFTVASIRKDPGAEYRQIIGNVAGEVWMLLASLQREAAAGAVNYIDDKKPVENIKKAKKTVKKKAKSKKK